MRTFKDGQGREWQVDVTVGTIKRVQRLMGVLITDLGMHDSALTLAAATDPLMLPNLLYAVCEPQATAAGVTDEQFGEALAGDVLAVANDTLIEAVVDFFPNAQRRDVTRKVLGKTRDVVQMASQQAIAAMDAMPTATLMEKIAETYRTPSKSATDTPASSV